MEEYTVQLKIENRYGTFLGKKVILTSKGLEELETTVKTFYMSGGFELTLEDGSLVIVPPDIVKETILTLIRH
jgi:hypothetical protein